MKLFDLVRRTVGKLEAGVEKAVEAVLDVPFSRFNRNPAWVEKFGGRDEWDEFWNGNR